MHMGLYTSKLSEISASQNEIKQVYKVIWQRVASLLCSIAAIQLVGGSTRGNPDVISPQKCLFWCGNLDPHLTRGVPDMEVGWIHPWTGFGWIVFGEKI